MKARTRVMVQVATAFSLLALAQATDHANKTCTADTSSTVPAETFTTVISLQAAVVDGHIAAIKYPESPGRNVLQAQELQPTTVTMATLIMSTVHDTVTLIEQQQVTNEVTQTTTQMSMQTLTTQVMVPTTETVISTVSVASTNLAELSNAPSSSIGVSSASLVDTAINVASKPSGNSSSLLSPQTSLPSISAAASSASATAAPKDCPCTCMCPPSSFDKVQMGQGMGPAAPDAKMVNASSSSYQASSATSISTEVAAVEQPSEITQSAAGSSEVIMTRTNCTSTTNSTTTSEVSASQTSETMTASQDSLAVQVQESISTSSSTLSFTADDTTTTSMSTSGSTSSVLVESPPVDSAAIESTTVSSTTTALPQSATEPKATNTTLASTTPSSEAGPIPSSLMEVNVKLVSEAPTTQLPSSSLEPGALTVETPAFSSALFYDLGGDNNPTPR